MDAIWGSGDHVQCIHPMAGCICGRQDVRLLSFHIIPRAQYVLIRTADVAIGFLYWICVSHCVSVDRDGAAPMHKPRPHVSEALRPFPQVMESWRLVLGNDAFDSIQLQDVRVHTAGSLVRSASPFSSYFPTFLLKECVCHAWKSYHRKCQNLNN